VTICIDCGGGSRYFLFLAQWSMFCRLEGLGHWNRSSCSSPNKRSSLVSVFAFTYYTKNARETTIIQLDSFYSTPNHVLGRRKLLLVKCFCFESVIQATLELTVTCYLRMQIYKCKIKWDWQCCKVTNLPHFLFQFLSSPVTNVRNRYPIAQFFFHLTTFYIQRIV
jgi:hypothetical protein